MSKIYVASSWRNEIQPSIVEALREAGHEVYDFKNPPHGQGGFHWSDIDKGWEDWDPLIYREMLEESHVAAHGFLSDMRAMEWADKVVLVLPCGKSAHLELGWFAGRGKPSYVYMPWDMEVEPELMYLMNTKICCTLAELKAYLK